MQKDSQAPYREMKNTTKPKRSGGYFPTSLSPGGMNNRIEWIMYVFNKISSMDNATLNKLRQSIPYQFPSCGVICRLACAWVYI